MDAFPRHRSTRAAIAALLLACALVPSAPASAAESAADQYRPGVAGAAGSAEPRDFGTGNPADRAAAATAPDFNVVRNDTDGGGRGGLVFLIALGAGFLLTAGLIAWHRRTAPGRPLPQ